MIFSLISSSSNTIRGSFFCRLSATNSTTIATKEKHTNTLFKTGLAFNQHITFFYKMLKSRNHIIFVWFWKLLKCNFGFNLVMVSYSVFWYKYTVFFSCLFLVFIFFFFCVSLVSLHSLVLTFLSHLFPVVIKSRCQPLSIQTLNFHFSTAWYCFMPCVGLFCLSLNYFI